jgi:hypothetical protein
MTFSYKSSKLCLNVYNCPFGSWTMTYIQKREKNDKESRKRGINSNKNNNKWLFISPFLFQVILMNYYSFIKYPCI